MDKMENITDKMIAYIYKHEEQREIKRGEIQFLGRVENNQDQFTDWLLYDYKRSDKKTFGEIYLQQEGTNVGEEERVAIEKSIKSYLGLYEVIQVKEDSMQVKNVFTHEIMALKKDDVDEPLPLYALFAARIGGEVKGTVLSSSIVVLPYQYKTLLTGQIIEDYEETREKNSYLDYPRYFKENALSFLQIINRMISYGRGQGDEEDFQVFQSTYVLMNLQEVKEKLLASPHIKYQESLEEGELFILFEMHEENILGEILLGKNKLDLECNTELGQKRAKKLLEKIVPQGIAHMKDEKLTIEDLL